MSLRIASWSLIVLYTGLLSVFSDGGLSSLSEKERKEYLHRSKVWHQTDIPNTNILAGPESEIAVPFDQQVTCQYVEPQSKPSGYAPKFMCRLSSGGQVVHVKYDTREVYGEVAGTRLLWSLGFFTDRNYAVKLRCLGCPEKNPFHPSQGEARVERTINNALIEQDFPGEIANSHDEGWAWKELNDVDEKSGGSSKTEIDALKLIAVFMQHMDSKHQQQRIGCYLEDIVREGNKELCKRPVLMIQDLGETFGAGGANVSTTSSMNLEAWKSQRIWNQNKEAQYTADSGQRTCFGNLTSAQFARDDGLFDPEISEAGREFLANLLNQLSDQQISDLFHAARADKTGDTIIENGIQRPVTIDDWVAAFKEKRQEINEHRCG